MFTKGEKYYEKVLSEGFQIHKEVSSADFDNCYRNRWWNLRLLLRFRFVRDQSCICSVDRSASSGNDLCCTGDKDAETQLILKEGDLCWKI